MKILITGCASFAGINFGKYFKRKYEVIGFYTKEIADYPKLAEKIYDRIMVGDIRNLRDVKKAVSDVDVVINEEAIIEAPFSVKFPTLTHDINVNGFLNVLECARQIKCKVVCVSSNIAYGEPLPVWKVWNQEVYFPIDESHPQFPNSPYGASRSCQEKYAIAYFHSYDLPVIVLRYSNLYGPYGKGVINAFIRDAREKGVVKITGNGKQTRTFTYIDDASRGTELAIKSKDAIGEVFNIAGPETANLLQILEIIKEYFPKLKVKKVKSWKGDILSSNYQISIERAKSILGYEPKYDLKKGIKKLIDFEEKEY